MNPVRIGMQEAASIARSITNLKLNTIPPLAKRNVSSSLEISPRNRKKSLLIRILFEFNTINF